MDLQLERAISEIKGRRAAVVALQVPEGLRTRARTMAREIEEATGSRVLIMGDPCYGACDLRTPAGVDMLVHVGHAPMPDLGPVLPTIFLEARMDFDVVRGLSDNAGLLRSKVGLVATAQHVHLLPQAVQALDALGIKAVVGKGDRRTASPGQVLGCNVTSALAIMDQVEQFVFMGSGYFHPLAVALGTGLPVLSMDPYRGAVVDLEEAREKVMRQRYAAMAKARDARDWLVIVCDKPGQRRDAAALRCQGHLREKGMAADLVLLNEVRPEALMAYRAQAAVSTACPRLAIDDGPHYPIPLLTPWELEMVLGLRSMEEYRLDQILEGDTPN